jgi:hypothetical protein
MTTNTNANNSSSIFQGTAPPNVNTTTTATTNIPTAFSSYQDYLNNLAGAGNASLSTPASQLVAPLSANQTGAFNAAPSAAQTYQSPLSSAETTAGTAAGGVGANQINAFMNPYITDVNKALETATQQNINQTVLPALQAFGATSGNTGSSRLLNATGQTLGQIQQGLGAQESSNLANAYQSAATNALNEQQNLGNIANVQGNLASTGQTAANAALTEQANLGAQEQAQNQAIINAPLTQASNAAALLKGYTVPTSSTTTYNGPASVYGPSQFSQLLAAGSLANSLPSGTLSGLGDLIKQGGTSLLNALTPSVSGSTSAVAASNIPSGLTFDPSTGQYTASDGSTYTYDQNGNFVNSAGVEYVPKQS